MENSTQRLEWGGGDLENIRRRKREQEKKRTAVMEEEIRPNKTEEEETEKYDKEH